MVAHVGALHDHVHVVQVGKDRILQALTVVGVDRFQNIRVLLNDRFSYLYLMMDGEKTWWKSSSRRNTVAMSSIARAVRCCSTMEHR